MYLKKTLHSYVLAKAMHTSNMDLSYIINWLIIFFN